MKLVRATGSAAMAAWPAQTTVGSCTMAMRFVWHGSCSSFLPSFLPSNLLLNRRSSEHHVSRTHSQLGGRTSRLAGLAACLVALSPLGTARAQEDHSDSLETATLLSIGLPRTGVVDDVSDEDHFRLDLIGSVTATFSAAGHQVGRYRALARRDSKHWPTRCYARRAHVYTVAHLVSHLDCIWHCDNGMQTTSSRQLRSVPDVGTRTTAVRGQARRSLIALQSY